MFGRKALPGVETFQRLPKTRDEALAIADLLVDVAEDEALTELGRVRKSRSGSVTSAFVDLHLGAHASRERLQGSLRS